MKSLVVVCVLLFVGLSAADTVTYPRGCIYILGKCHKECPEGTRAYAIGCGRKTPEATCREPNPVPEPGILCDYSACYCDAPTVRDEKTDKCVLKEKCSPQETDPKVLVDPPPTMLLPPVEDSKPEPSTETPEPKKTDHEPSKHEVSEVAEEKKP